MEKDGGWDDVSVCACFETAIRSGCTVSFLISKHQSSIIQAGRPQVSKSFEVISLCNLKLRFWQSLDLKSQPITQLIFMGERTCFLCLLVLFFLLCLLNSFSSSCHLLCIVNSSFIFLPSICRVGELQKFRARWVWGWSWSVTECCSESLNTAARIWSDGKVTQWNAQGTKQWNGIGEGQDWSCLYFNKAQRDFSSLTVASLFLVLLCSKCIQSREAKISGTLLRLLFLEMLMIWLQLHDSWVSSRALFPSVDVWWQLGDCSLQSSGTCVQEAPSLWLPWRQCTNLHQVGGNGQLTFSSLCSGGGEQCPRERPWPFLDTSQWHMPRFQQSLDASELLPSPEILLSCVCAEISPVDNFYCRTEGKWKMVRPVKYWCRAPERWWNLHPWKFQNSFRQGFEQCDLASS